MQSKDFRAFDFGYSEAVTELRQSPNLLRNGYYDLGGIEERILSSHEFLLLGYKGAGKSMVGARLNILGQDSPSLYNVPNALSVDRLPLPGFRDAVPDAFDAQVRYQHAWSLLLLSHIVDVLSHDSSAVKDSAHLINMVKSELSAAGVIASSPETLKRLRTSKITHKFTLPKFYERTQEIEPQNQAHAITIWISLLEEACRAFKSSKHTFVVVDGLDDLRLVDRGGGPLLLGGLLQAVANMNELFQLAKAPIKVILCCRTDLYLRLSTARRGKIRRDYGLELNWYQNPRDYGTSHLIRIANLRARLVERGLRDIFNAYFPSRLYNEPTPVFLLKNTRHTPRDMLQLLKIIGRLAEGPGPLPQRVVQAGLAEYSKTYFMDELDDALSPYFDEAQRPLVRELLGTLRRRQFSVADLEAATRASRQLSSRLDPESVVDALFSTGFAGNVTLGGPTGDDDPYYRFKFRSQDATLRLDEPLLLHLGLWKALNIA